MFAHHWKDAWLVLLSGLSLGLVLFGLMTFDQLSWPAILGLGVVLVFLNCTNYQCVAHNFLHNPFFRWTWLNNLFSVVNSVALGLPQTLYKYHHLNHHKYNNDVQIPETGTTEDRSSTYRHSGPEGQEEHILPYSLLGPFRTELGVLYGTARSKRRTALMWVESAAMLAFSVTLLCMNWTYFLGFVVPVWFLGQSAALAENYLEHHYARPGNRLTDSVSCYGWLYNLLWFNNGYHQEHHYRPTVHWTKVKDLRGEMLPEDQRRVVKGAHWFNFGQPVAVPAAVETAPVPSEAPVPAENTYTNV